MPLKSVYNEYREGARHTQTLTQYIRYGKGYSQATKFENSITAGLIDKIKAGVDLPSYPQFRDMNEMFLDLIDGITRISKGYIAVKKITLKPEIMIPEVYAVKSNLNKIIEATNTDEIKLKICVTGPYTLSTLFSSRTTDLIEDLGEVLKKLTSNSIFKVKGGKTALLSIDEPIFGFIDDPLLDKGCSGREALKKAWEGITQTASTKGVETMIHLHNTSDNLFWEVERLDIVGSHVDDPIYSKSTKRRLTETGKKLNISVAVTSFDDLLRKTVETPEELGRLWTRIYQGKVNPEIFLDSAELISDRLNKSLELFGEDNILYASPECGLGGFPTYECALKYLQRISSVIKKTTEKD